MKNILDLIKKNPILSYFILTFTISWGSLVVMIAVNGMPATMAEAQAQLPIAIITFLGGPCISGLLMTGIMSGRKGYRELLSRLLKWRVGIGWYVFAIFSGPVVLLAVPLFLSLFSPVFLPEIFSISNKTPMLILGIFSGIIVGICEEIGWTGFAIPRMRKRYSVLLTGLILGVLWGAWHILTNDIWVIRAYTGPLPPALYATLTGLGFLIGQLPPFRILMVWVYDRTGSLLISMIMHFSLTAVTVSFMPVSGIGTSIFILSFALSAVMWIFTGVILLANRKQFLG